MAGDDALGHSDGSSPSSASNPDLDSMRLSHTARSSSPAKRSASERDGDEQSVDNQMDVDAPERQVRSPKKSTVQVSSLPSRIKSMSSPEDVQQEEGTLQNDGTAQTEDSSIPSFDEQARIVKDLVDNTQLTEGIKGYIISTQWFTRVLARTAQGLGEGHPKAMREGPVGPLDNTDIAITSGMGDLKDESGDQFVPLNPDMSMHNDFEIIPRQAWNLIKRWYGIVEGSPVITRYVHNTSDRGAAQNLMYEIHPPMVTIQKLRNDTEGMSQETLRDRDRPSIRMVVSRHDQYQDFLKRAKTAANIPMATKVQVWKILDTSPPQEFHSAIPTPVMSGEPSPTLNGDPPAAPKLVIDFETLSSMAEGVKRELLHLKDETANEKYNGHANLGTLGFSETQSLILEEQVRPDGDEQYISDKLRKIAKQNGIDLNPSDGNKSSTQNKFLLKDNKENGRKSPTPGGMMTRGRNHRNGRTKGTVGFQNLGNTCYMNSALQCIRSIEELTIYFLAEKYKSEINANNPLGYNGSMAKVYAGLVASVYESVQSFSPRIFKGTLGRCQPLFSSYGQQDSQEFLSFLVDALHEDLNRIQKKPYIENPDSDDKTVHDPEVIKQLGETYRNNHRARNDSIATDLFTGFYKNTMICPACDKVSVTFDPYSALTLQLPVENTWQHTFTLWPIHSPPVKVHVDIDKNSNLRMVKEYVAKRVKGVRSEALVIAEVYNHRFFKTFKDYEIISEVNLQENDDLHIYELDEKPTNWTLPEELRSKKSSYSISSNEDIPSQDSVAADRMAVPVIHRMRRSSESSAPFGLCATVILVTREEARDYDSILRKVLQRVATMTTKDIFESQHEERNHGETDAVVMVDGEALDDNQVQAKSVEGDDELVDVSMTDKANTSAEGQHLTTSHNMSSIPRGGRGIANPNMSLSSELTSLFEMRVYKSTSEVIPVGWSSMSESTKYPLLSARVERRRSSAGSQRRRPSLVDRVNSNSSDDELSLPDLGHDGSQQSHNNQSDAESDDSSDARRPRSNMSSAMNRLKKTGAAFIKGRRSKKQQGNENSEVQVSLLKLGEGLVLDWNEEGYEQLFGGSDEDSFRGQNTFKEPPLVVDPELDARRERRSLRKKNGVSIEECFRETTKEEILSEENAWYCGRCKKLQRASKTLEIWTVPDILVLHLKRFSTNSRLRDKIDVLVDFPITDLDLTGKVGLSEDKSLHYDLFAVDNHYGGLGGGHYTAVAQNFYDKKWYDYNDSSVSEVQPEQAVTRAAYLLFYRRRSSSPLGPQYLQQLVKDHYSATTSDPEQPAGEDQRPDGSASRNGSSSNSHPAAAAVGALHPPGSPSAGRGLASPARSASRVTLVSKNYDSDEGISLDMDDDRLADINRRLSDFNAQPPQWSWDSVPGGGGSAGSDREMEDSDTLNGGMSDLPALGSYGGGTPLNERMADFGDESMLNSYGPPTPDSDIGGYKHVEHVHGIEVDDSDGEVAEVRLDDEEGA